MGIKILSNRGSGEACRTRCMDQGGIHNKTQNWRGWQMPPARCRRHLFPSVPELLPPPVGTQAATTGSPRLTVPVPIRTAHKLGLAQCEQNKLHQYNPEQHMPQGGTHNELTEYKANLSRELASVTPFLEMNSRERKSVQRVPCMAV